MRTLLIIGGGFLLLAVMAVAGRAVGHPMAALKLFLPAWLAVAAANMWIGVARAGYTVMEELPIAVAIFGLPALVALALLRAVRA